MAAIAWDSRRPVDRAVGLVALVVAVGGPLGIVHAEPALTEVAALGRAYGAGVHSYFSGDAQRAYEDLTQAIEAGTSDPRAWYFRGLAALKLGRLDEAEADFSTAATRETEAAGDWAVGRSLERVQGRDRLALERHRVRARVAGLEQRRQAVQRRYSDIESRQEEVQRQRRPDRPTRDAAEQFGGEDVSAPPVTRPGASPEPVAPPAPAEGVREAPAGELTEQTEAGDGDVDADPPMKDADPQSDAATATEAPPAAEGIPEADPAADVEKPALDAEDPAASSGQAEEAVKEMAEEGATPPAADAPGGEVFGK